jgi:hypothetical protein
MIHRHLLSVILDGDYGLGNYIRISHRPNTILGRVYPPDSAF